jgi:CheY-like chemotaxis protein
MPGLDGLELAGSILDRFAGTRIVLITADQVVRRLEPGNLVGVSSVLIKPFPVKELIKAKRKAVAENNV